MNHPTTLIDNTDSRLHFITGKGGVGKTTVSCALAYKTVKLGLDTLLIAINPAHPIEAMFEVDYSFNSTGIQEIRPGLWTLNLDQRVIFDNFIKKSLKIRKLYDTVLASPIYNYFAAIAPGIKELITQELIIEALQRSKAFENRYFDIIIVDSPATGHGLSWFSVPDAILKTFLVGPLNKKAQEIRRLWLDENVTSIHLVTLPEEMPVNETIEFYVSLNEKLHFPVKSVILNGIFPDISKDYKEIELRDLLNKIRSISDSDKARIIFKDVVPLIEKSVIFYENRRKINDMFGNTLKESIPLPLRTIPMVFDKNGPMRLIEQLSDFL